jgi:hypothetical protein
MMWCDQFPPRVNLSTTRILIYYKNFPESPNTSVDQWSWNKLPLGDLYQRRISPPRSGRPTLTQVLHCQLAGLEQSSSPSHRMYAFLLVKTNERHVTLSNAFQHLEAISPRIHSDRLDPSSPDIWWQKLSRAQGFWLQTPQKNSKLRNILAHSSQLINQILNARLNMSVFLSSYRFCFFTRSKC